MKISVRIPELEKEYDVNVPSQVTGDKLYTALLQKMQGVNMNDGRVYELFCKRIQKKVYPDHKDDTLEYLGLKDGDTIIVKQDAEPGAHKNKSEEVLD